jgi:hypothetical protein
MELLNARLCQLGIGPSIESNEYSSHPIQMERAELKMVEGGNKETLVSFRKSKSFHCLFDRLVEKSNYSKNPESYTRSYTVSRDLFSFVEPKSPCLSNQAFSDFRIRGQKGFYDFQAA